MKLRISATACGAAMLGFVLLAGCGKKEEEQPAATSTPAPAAAPAATPIDPATAATVVGVVKFDGAAPKAAKIDMSQDPNCQGSNTAENVVVADGTWRTSLFTLRMDSGRGPSICPPRW